ncbi:MAG: polyprenyl synthetase family protein [Treponema sp.]|jgi:octaprenyl-diphosphate synthase|nr:polyprenyl synthetase family protein [Treponema sp.]
MEKEYTQRLEKIEAVLDKWLPEAPDSSWLEMVFGSQLNSAVKGTPELAGLITRPGWDLVKRGGKRWRPLLMVLAAEAIAGECGFEVALSLTPLVEFPHNASLIHDDIEDNSDERRGKPAVHLIYGMDTAINSGAFMYFLPLACLSAWTGEYSKEKSGDVVAEWKNRMWQVWASHMRALHLGQAMDIAWHRDFYSLPDLDEYDRMCRLKTGCLARLAAVLGVYSGVFAAGETFNKESNLKALEEAFAGAAEQLGVGFQILDDVKNLTTGVPGKKRGDDIVEGKKSLPVLLYLHRYPEKKDFAARCFTAARNTGVEAPEVEEFISKLERAEVIEEARIKALSYIQKSTMFFSNSGFAGFSFKKEGMKLLAGFPGLLL